MKQILKFAACILLFGSCKKELSCEGCAGKNKPPIANADADQIIILPKDSVLLDGSASTNADGTITSYKWAKISGPASANIAKPGSSTTIGKSLVAGVYQFELKVTDDKKLSATATVQIFVIDPSLFNQPPVANAGPSKTITGRSFISYFRDFTLSRAVNAPFYHFCYFST